MEESLHMLNSIGDLEEDYALLNAQICQDMSAYPPEKGGRLFLVLDDFHNVLDNPAIGESIRYFTTNMPDWVSMIVTSRADPAIVTGKMLLDDRIKQIHKGSLLFTREEIKELVGESYRMQLSEKQMDYLFSRSEGWIAGIYMICHGMDVTREGEEGRSLRKQENVFALFLDEFLQKLDEEKRDTLIHLSVLEDFSKEDLGALTDLADPEGFMEWLETSNLYIEKIVGTPTKYRFHALFREALERHFQETVSLSEQKNHYIKLSDYYRYTDLQESIRFALLAGREDQALRLAAESCRQDFLDGTPENSLCLVNAFSREQAYKEPCLLLFRGMKYINTDREESWVCLLQAMEEFRKRKQYSFLMNTFGMVMVIAFQTNDFQNLAEARKRIPMVSGFLTGGAVRTKLIISLFISLTGQDKLSAAAFFRRMLDKKRIGEDLWQFSYLMIRGVHCYRRGQLREAVVTMQQILEHPVGRSNDQWRIIALASCCNTAFLTGDPDLMEQFINDFLLLGEKYNSDFALGYGNYVSAHRRYIRKDIDAALRALENATEEYKKYGGDALVREMELMAALWNEEAAAEDSLHGAEENLRFLTNERPGHGLVEFALAVTGVLYKRKGQWKTAERYLKESLAISEKKGARQSVWGIQLHLADLYYEIGDEEIARRYLENWETMGEENDYIFAREMDYGTLERVCSRAQGEERPGRHACRMAQLYLERTEDEGADSSADDVIQVGFFGQFRIQGTDFRIIETDFKTRKVSGILKYILANHRKTAVSRGHLASIFWPDAESKTANTSLRVALYELRKTMERFRIGFESETALLEETKEGFRVAKGVNIATDLEVFDEKYRQWKNGNLSQEEERRVLQEICGIYQGDFLDNAYDDDWVALTREHYSSMFLECLHGLSKIRIEEGDIDGAENLLLRGMEKDPLDEIGCEILVDLYRNTGQTDRAETLRRQFRKRFKQEMGFETALK